jgi:hypothetical protein
MTNGAKLSQDIQTAKDLAMNLAANYIALAKNGEDLGCKELNLAILIGKIEAMETFYGLNFDANNNNIDPLYICPQTTLIRKYIDPNYQPPVSGLEINIIDGGNA